LLVAPEDPSIVKRVEELDVDLDSIATMNGCVNLNTGELTTNEPSHMATSCIRVAYDPDATSPELDRYLETFIPDKTDQDVVFAILGTALRGGNTCRMLPIFLGHTTSGKSQLLAALTRLLGGYATAINVSVFRGNLDDKPRPDLVKAMFTRLAYATEASKSWELHADQVKRLTGGDSIPYRNLYSQGVEATPRFTPLIVTNDMPRVKGADAAFKRRMIVVRFDRTIATQDEDPLIKERFVRDKRCLQAILARMVAGARSPLFRHGIKWDNIPQRFASDTMECFDELDHIGEFLDWMKDHGHLVEVDSPSVVPRVHCAKASNLHAWYMMWIKRHGDKIDKADALNMRDFGTQLRSRGWTSAMAAGTRWVGWKLVSEITWM
jgi:putative DNA primase/helicase